MIIVWVWGWKYLVKNYFKRDIYRADNKVLWIANDLWFVLVLVILICVVTVPMLRLSRRRRRPTTSWKGLMSCRVSTKYLFFFSFSFSISFSPFLFFLYPFFTFSFFPLLRHTIYESDEWIMLEWRGLPVWTNFQACHIEKAHSNLFLNVSLHT